jgi:hypothetical protein
MFAEDAGFDRVAFFRHAEFAGAMFAGAVRFNEAMFAGAAGFGAAKFTALTKFDGARVALSSRLVLLPTGWTTRAAQPGEGEEEDWLYVVRGQDSSEQPTEATDDGEG